MTTSRIPVRIHHKERGVVEALVSPIYYATETGVARVDCGGFIPDYVTLTTKVLTHPTSGADPGGALWLDCVISIRKHVIAIQRKAKSFTESIRGFEVQILQWDIVQVSDLSILTFCYALLGYTEPLYIPNPQGFAFPLESYEDIDLGDFEVGCPLSNVHDSLVKPLHQDTGGFRQMIALSQDEVSRLTVGMKTL